MDEAVELLAADPEARPIAGGTAMLIMLKQGVFRPERLLNLAKIRDAAPIEVDDEGAVRIGALASMRQVEHDAVVRERFPSLAHACHVVANVRIRNLATIGGNLSHADHQSDPPAMLMLLGARVAIRSARGTHEEALSSFLVSSYQTTLEPDELVTGVVVPPLPEGYRTRYVKFTTRSSEDRPCAGIAVAMDVRKGRCAGLRVVVGAVSPRPFLATEAADLAIGEPMTAALAEAIGARIAGSLDPVGDVRGSVDYKRHLVRVLVRRTLVEVAGAAA